MKREFSSRGPWALCAWLCAVVLLLGVFLVGRGPKPVASGKAALTTTRSTGAATSRAGAPALERFPGLKRELREGTPARPSAPSPARSYGRLPLSFEANKGQSDGQVKFLSRGRGYTLFLTGNEAVLALRKPAVASWQSAFGGPLQGSEGGLRSPFPERRGRFPLSPVGHARGFAADSTSLWRGLLPSLAALITGPHSQAPGFFADLETRIPKPENRESQCLLRMRLVGADPAAKVVGFDELAGKSNYFIGNDPRKWRTKVPNYARVRYQGVYPGVDLVYYGNQRQLEYDFVVAPGADPNVIALDVAAGLPRQPGSPAQDRDGGVKPPLRIDANGDLVVSIDAGEVIFHKPVVYQPADIRQSSVVSVASGKRPRTTDHGQRTLWMASTL